MSSADCRLSVVVSVGWLLSVRGCPVSIVGRFFFAGAQLCLYAIHSLYILPGLKASASVHIAFTLRVFAPHSLTLSVCTEVALTGAERRDRVYLCLRSSRALQIYTGYTGLKGVLVYGGGRGLLGVSGLSPMATLKGSI